MRNLLRVLRSLVYTNLTNYSLVAYLYSIKTVNVVTIFLFTVYIYPAYWSLYFNWSMTFFTLTFLGCYIFLKLSQIQNPLSNKVICLFDSKYLYRRMLVKKTLTLKLPNKFCLSTGEAFSFSTFTLTRDITEPPKEDFLGDSRKRSLKMSNNLYYKLTSPKVKQMSDFYKKLFWIKSRFMYFANNWIYTTNHKRIAINYFFFILFSGTCGMALATIIRLEMAYPGVGILAGDSLQYLSIVTAHAVIMVFFMIMPLLAGAYSNFLLPTQLGVHDVAFPRLNSAAFWFLPAGLIMLAQLVCLDRRYQRMNCFNMRELQALLKEKYYTDLVTGYDHRNNILNSLNLRFKLNDLTAIDSNLFMFVNNSIKSSESRRSSYFEVRGLESLNLSTWTTYKLIVASHELDSSGEFWSYTLPKVTLPDFGDMVLDLTRITKTIICDLGVCFSKILTSNFSVRSLLSYSSSLIADLCDYVFEFGLEMGWFLNTLRPSMLETLVAFDLRCNTAVSTLRGVISLFIPQAGFTWTPSMENYQERDDYLVTEKSTLLPTYLSNLTFNVGESVEDTRGLRSISPVLRYDYKLGNYLPKDSITVFTNRFISQIQVTGGIRKSAWWHSTHFTELFDANLKNYISLFTIHSELPAYLEAGVSYNSSTYGFYNLIFDLNTDSNNFNLYWMLGESLTQKFNKIFLTSSIQQRIYSNWRQLKFSREAWRCKLLASRHQKTLYRRYLNEDGVFWAVERNAKDVLPGWAMITPFSARTRFTAIGKVDLGLMGVFLVLNSSIVSSANFLITYRYLSTLNNRKRRDARSFFTEGILVSAWMMIAANPMLAIGILMLLSDRHWQTSFFDYSGGGDTVLFQHMFWFFGHPEVYIIMIPTFGFTNTILSFYLRKRVSARASLMYSMYTIAFLGFFVWGHHMYMVGLAHTTRMLFSTLTVMISVPAATKLMHWCVTLVNSSMQIELPLLYAFLFIFFFVSGGISGMAVAHTGMDILFHDTFYVVGHFHVMLAGAAMFGAFGALYFYFPAIFGVKFNRTYAYLHFVYYLLGQLMTVIPMFWLGYSGMPRRVLDYPSALGGWHSVASAGHLLSVAGMLAFFIMIFDSMRQNKAAAINVYGLARFNTRLNFYLYESSKALFIHRKCLYVSRADSFAYTSDSRIALINQQLVNSSNYSYVFVRVKTRECNKVNQSV